jgi:antitoxin component of RelBE/YafQ-DinJ toxin-antitoxin module
MNLTLDDSTFRQLKAIAALKDLTVGELIKLFVDREIQEKPEECELCLRYREPDQETVKTFENTDKGIGLSKKMSGKEALKMFDKEFLKK